MGGGLRFHYPKWVWSPAGGWWPSPKHWKRNTVIYLSVVGVFALWVVDYTKDKTIRYDRNVKPMASKISHD